MKSLSYSLFFCFSFLVVGISACNKNEQSNVNRPNIIFILADDLGWGDLSCLGQKTFKTPNIDKLADRGVRFTNNYVMGGHHGAISAPSRAMLLTGKSLYHVYDVLDGEFLMNADGALQFIPGRDVVQSYKAILSKDNAASKDNSE